MTTEIFKKNSATAQEWQKTESQKCKCCQGKTQVGCKMCKADVNYSCITMENKKKKKHKDRGEYTLYTHWSLY